MGQDGAGDGGLRCRGRAGAEQAAGLGPGHGIGGPVRVCPGLIAVQQLRQLPPGDGSAWLQACEQAPVPGPEDRALLPCPCHMVQGVEDLGAAHGPAGGEGSLGGRVQQAALQRPLYVGKIPRSSIQIGKVVIIAVIFGLSLHFGFIFLQKSVYILHLVLRAGIAQAEAPGIEALIGIAPVLVQRGKIDAQRAPGGFAGEEQVQAGGQVRPVLGRAALADAGVLAHGPVQPAQGKGAGVGKTGGVVGQEGADDGHVRAVGVGELDQRVEPGAGAAVEARAAVELGHGDHMGRSGSPGGHLLRGSAGQGMDLHLGLLRQHLFLSQQAYGIFHARNLIVARRQHHGPPEGFRIG